MAPPCGALSSGVRSMVRVAFTALVFAGLAGAAGYFAGFRSGWSLSVAAYNSVTASNAIVQLKAIASGRPEDAVRIAESEVDLALQTWGSLDHYGLKGGLNLLSGD